MPRENARRDAARDTRPCRPRIRLRVGAAERVEGGRARRERARLHARDRFALAGERYCRRREMDRDTAGIGCGETAARNGTEAAAVVRQSDTLRTVMAVNR